MQRIQNPAKEDVRIGVVGPRELVERILIHGRQFELPGWRLVGSSHVEENETYDKVLQIADQVDVVLFTGPLQSDLAQESGEIPIPTTFVPVMGTPLYSSIIRGVIDGTLDPARVSVDSILDEDVAEAYADIGVSNKHVHTREYQGPSSVKEFFYFHRDLYLRGATSAALTTVQSVARRLKAENIPVLRMLPTSNSIRIALNTAALLGAGSKLEESQIAIIVAEISTSSRSVRRGPSNYWHQELMLSLHQRLLAEVRGVGATVVQRDEDSFVVTATRGSLSALTDNMREAPFIRRIRTDTGLAIDVGIGLGATARDAEEHAYMALERSRGGDSSMAYLMGPSSETFALPAQLQRSSYTQLEVPKTKASETAQKIADRLGPDQTEPIIVDAEAIAVVLGVTTRSARRILTMLVENGTAWPMPALRSPSGGRPRQQFRLIVEKRGKDCPRYTSSPNSLIAK
jgi:hypothetical protein